MITYFMFATGVENSSPTIRQRSLRIDEMESCGHYRHWQTDFELLRELGIGHLRYGLPLHKVLVAPGTYDWEFSDVVFGDLLARNVTPIADLCHFGVPDFIGDFQNPDFGRLFGEYAGAFARRYPWIQLYTPINEMFICALFSARYGWWNEELTTERSFVTALKNIVRANVLAMEAILAVRKDAIFVQSESSEYFHATGPAAIEEAAILNELRFLSLDLNYGHRVNSDVYEYLMDNGMTREEYQFFLKRTPRHHCVLGNDYYVTNEHHVFPDGRRAGSGEIFGYAMITKQYYDRYRIPVMHTETNFHQGPQGDEAVKWLRKQWANVIQVRNEGVPIVGFTWYSLTDQKDWDTALREPNDRVNPVGLCDLDRKIRPVGEAYRELISEWRDVLPTQSVALTLPVFPPNVQGHPLVRNASQTVGERDEHARNVSERPRG